MHPPCVPAWMGACTQVSTSSSLQVLSTVKWTVQNCFPCLKSVISTEGHAELDSQETEIDWQNPNKLHRVLSSLPQHHLGGVRLRLDLAWSGHKDLWAYTAYQDNAGRLHQVEKDKLHVTCITLFGCPDHCREGAVSWAQMGTQKALAGILPGGRPRDHGLDSKQARKKAKKQESKKLLNWQQKHMAIYCCPHTHFSQVVHI